MPRMLKKRAKRQKEAKKENQERTLRSRLLEISVEMDAYIYYKRVIQTSEARNYLQELQIYEESCLDVRSKQVVEKLVNFMQRIIEEEGEELRAKETLGNFECAAFASNSVVENCIQTPSIPENRLSSPFDFNRLDGPEGNKENMNDEDVDINGNQKNCSQLNSSHRKQGSDSFQTNNDQVTLLSQSVLQDHNYTSWEGPKHFQEPVSKSNAFVGTPRKPRSFTGNSQKNIMILPYQSPSLAKKYVLVKIPVGNRPKTPSPAKYIKINPSPRRELNVPPNYASKESSKKVLFRNVNSNIGLPANYSQKYTNERMAPKKPALLSAIESNNIEDHYSQKQKNKKNTISKLLSDEENKIKKPKNKTKRNVSQETNVNTDCRKRKRGKNKLKPNEEDLSWVENLKFVRVIEKDEACTPNMTLTDAFWKNLDYPQDWDDGVYLM